MLYEQHITFENKCKFYNFIKSYEQMEMIIKFNSDWIEYRYKQEAKLLEGMTLDQYTIAIINTSQVLSPEKCNEYLVEFINLSHILRDNMEPNAIIEDTIDYVENLERLDICIDKSIEHMHCRHTIEYYRSIADKC